MPKFVHLRNLDKNRGGITIAYSVDEDTKVVYYAIARCNPKDNFCRRTGRVKAAGRLLSPKHVREFKYNDWKEVHAHFLTYKPGEIKVLADLKDRPYGRSAVSTQYTEDDINSMIGVCGI